MIKINLLKSFYEASPESIQIDDEQKSIQSSFLKNIFVMCIGIAALFAYEMYNIPLLTQELNAINAEIAEATRFNQQMDGMRKEIERYEIDLKRLNSQTEFLQKVQKERTLSVELINRMKELITPKVWLNSLEVVEAAIEIKGESESISDVNDFNNRLAATNYLKDVITTSIETKVDAKIRDITIQSFNIRASYVDGKQLLDTVLNNPAGEVR